MATSTAEPFAPAGEGPHGNGQPPQGRAQHRAGPAARRVDSARHRASWPALLLLALGAVCALTLLQVAREPGFPSWDTMWQEDGGIFLTDALRHGGLASIGRPYNNYFHLVPRLLALAAVHLPLRDAALVFAVSSAAVVSLLGLYVFWAARAVLPPVWARAVLVAVFTLAPVTAYETVNNINNLHWYLVFALAWVPFSQPRTWRGRVAGLVVVLAATLSDTNALIVAPLFLPLFVHGLRRRRWADLAAPVLLGLCGIVQLLGGLHGHALLRYTPSYAADLPAILGYRLAGSLLGGDRWLVLWYQQGGNAFAYTMLAVLLGFLVAGFLLARGGRLQVLLWTALGAVFAVSGLMLRGTVGFLDRVHPNLNGSRYLVLPVWCITAALLVVAVRVASRLRDPVVDAAGTRIPLVPAVVGGAVAVLLVVNYADFNVRTVGPSWGAALGAAEDRCASTGGRPGDTGSSSISEYGTVAGPRDAVLRIAPNLPNATFTVVVSCARLLRG